MVLPPLRRSETGPLHLLVDSTGLKLGGAGEWLSKKAYRERHRIENAFCWLKDFSHIATRYDRLARNFLASIYLVATIV